MAEDTKIQWTDYTFNPWRGCTKVNAGCTNCYAEVNMSVKLHGVKWGPNGTRVKASLSMWRKPVAWNRAAEEEGVRKRVFCASLADVFEDWDGPILDHAGRQLFHDNMGYTHYPKLPAQRENPCTMDDLCADLFQLIDRTPWLDWQLLTKRPENVLKMWTGAPKCRRNCWIGTSVSDQETADEWIPRLLECRKLCPVLFLSAEPLLSPIDLRDYLDKLDWVISGGESGPKARECPVEGIRSIVRQCAGTETACFVKQLGSNPVTLLNRCINLKDSKGGDPSEWPLDLRVREFPRKGITNEQCKMFIDRDRVLPASRPG